MVPRSLPGKPRTTGLRPWLCPVEYDPRLRWVVSTERLLHRVAGSLEHSSLRLRTGRSVVRGKLVYELDLGIPHSHCPFFPFVLELVETVVDLFFL